MLRGGAIPATAVGLLALVVFALVDGALGAAGSVLATVVVMASFASSVILLSRTKGLDPRVVFLAAMVGYTTKVALLGLVLLLFRDAPWLSPMAFAVTAIAVSLVWTIGEVVAFTRVRTLIYDLPGDTGTPR